jgi:hypothetical protein
MEKQEEYQVEVISKNPGQLIALALEKGADPGTLEKLMDLQERWEAGNARKAYVLAMAGFKQEAPAVLIKGDKVDFTSSRGRTHYNYANLGSIVQEITTILGKFGLSASWETSQDEKDNIIVTCHITHSAGHRESVTLRGPADESGNKNRIQAVGSTVTYLQRYTLLAALGLATGEDDDGRQGAPNGKPPAGKPPVHPNPKIQTAIEFCLSASKKEAEILAITKKKTLADITESDLEVLRVWLTGKQTAKQSTKAATKEKAPETVDSKGVGQVGPEKPIEGRLDCPKGGQADPGWCAEGCDPLDKADCINFTSRQGLGG